MKILITGGAGFVGAHLAKELKRRYPDYDITVLDNLKRWGSALNLPAFKTLGIRFVHGDVRVMEDLEGVAFDLVIEASAEPSVLAGVTEGRRYLIDTNFNGLINVLEATLRQGARLIFLSTSRVYPMGVINALPYEETDTRYQLPGAALKGVSERGFSEALTTEGAKTLYGMSKRACEMAIEEYRENFDLEAIVNRCGVIAGAGQFGKVDQGFVTLWVAHYLFDKPLTIFGNGKQVRDILNIHDLFDLIDLQIHRFDRFEGECFNVGGGLEASVSLLELDRLCQTLFGPKKVDRAPQRALDIRYYVSDTAKIERLGWRAQRGVETTVQEIGAWIEVHRKELEWIFA